MTVVEGKYQYMTYPKGDWLGYYLLQDKIKVQGKNDRKQYLFT